MQITHYSACVFVCALSAVRCCVERPNRTKSRNCMCVYMCMCVCVCARWRNVSPISGGVGWVYFMLTSKAWLHHATLLLLFGNGAVVGLNDKIIKSVATLHQSSPPTSMLSW